MINLESLNFSETEVIWNDFPKMLRNMTLKVCIYMASICLLLSGMQNVKQMFEGEKNLPDKFTAGYDAKVLINFFVGVD